MQGLFVFLGLVALVAFIIALIKPQKLVFWTQKKTRGMACLYLVAMFIFFIISASVGGSSSSTTAVSTGSTSSSKSSAVSAQSTVLSSSAVSSSIPASSANLKQFDITFSSGFYTAGIDFPAGTYNLKAKKGGGNVTTDDGSLNVIMGTQKDDMYEKSYNNAEFSDGTVLQLAGVSIEITSVDKVDSALQKRQNAATKEYTFSSGNYTIGKNIEAGAYDITATKGGGNVTTDDGKLNAIMGTSSDSMYEKEYKNVPLTEGQKLSVSGVTIKLVPSK